MRKIDDGKQPNNQTKGAISLRTGRIVFLLGDSHNLDGSIYHVESKSLASIDQSNRFRSRMCQFHLQLFRQQSIRVSHELDHGIFWDLLIFGPGIHDGSIIHAVNDHFINAKFLECVLVCQVPGYLAGRSGWRETAIRQYIHM